MAVELVIPVGNGDPELNIPQIDLLELRLGQVKQQTIPVRLTCAIDVNLPDEKKAIVEKYADKVKIFPPDSYFREGGIWNKIYTCWLESDAEYVAWQGYDDYSSPNRFEKQVIKLEQTGANSCTCNNYFEEFDKITKKESGNFLHHLRRHYPYMGSFLLRRQAILNSGIGEYRFKWVYYFEGLLYAFVLKMGMPAISDGDFYYYEHKGTLSNTAKSSKDWVQKIILSTNYSSERCKKDWDEINFAKICSEVRAKYV